jgi:carbamoyl-phosphate synthase large subunit
MRSTGEVIGLDRDFGIAFAKSQLGGGTKVPASGTAFFSVRDKDKPRILAAAGQLHDLGFRIIATGGTQRFLSDKGIECERVNKVLEGRPHIVDAMANGEVELVFNTTEGAAALQDSKSIRRAALQAKIPYYTTLSGALAAVQGIVACSTGTLEVLPLQDYVSGA